MRRFALYLCGVCVAYTPAYAQINPSPDSNDRIDWIAYCSGFNIEIERQATLDNNQLLYNRAKATAQNLGDEGIVRITSMDSSKITDEDVKRTKMWREHGEIAAGKNFWDVAPLVDEGTSFSSRQYIVAMRSNLQQTCDNMGDESAAYHNKAEEIFQNMKKETAKSQQQGR